jgi:predicted DNA-binding protein with PD1-like motif
MQYSQGTIGRVFALKLETGERLPDAIEDFALEHEVRSAMAIYVGGAGAASRLVVGPEENRGDDIVPILHTLGGTQEVLAVGTLFVDENGHPRLHMHAATGREGRATVGCTRGGVEVWLIGEVILLEISGIGGLRKKDSKTGFQILQFTDRASNQP